LPPALLGKSRTVLAIKDNCYRMVFDFTIGCQLVHQGLTAQEDVLLIQPA
jgi:hypothetical protein